MRLLITGASGLLGSNLTLTALDAGLELFTSSLGRPLADPRVHWQPADLTQPEQAAALLAACAPDWVVNCAAATDVDRCEREPAWAEALNHRAAQELARAVREAGAGLIHLSTDAVFDGEGDHYRETDPAKPINVYGASKLRGEQAVLEEQLQALVVRTNFYGWSPPGRRSLAEWFLDRLAEEADVPGFSDVQFCPLLVNQLAELLLELTQSKLRGCYHLMAADCLTKQEFGKRIAAAFGHDPQRIVPTSVDQAGLAARRAHKLTLSVSKIEHDLGTRLPTVEQGIERLVRLGESDHRRRLRDLFAEPIGQADREQGVQQA